MTLKLKGNRVAVEKLKKQSGGSKGGLIMPDSEEYLGLIVHVGENVNPSLSLKIGQKVYFSTNYQESMMEGKKLCIMNDTEIFAVVE